MSKPTALVSILPVALLACAGEQAVDNKQPASIEDNAPMSKEEELQRRLEARQLAVRRFPERRVEEPTAHVIGEVPNTNLIAVKQDLAERLVASIDEFEVIKAQSITWPDGSLGCPKPGQNYTQALVPGYWIILVRDSEEYDYRASESGYFILCELPRTLDPRNEAQ